MNSLIGEIAALLCGLGVSVDAQGNIATQPTSQSRPRSVAEYAKHVVTGTWTEKRANGTVSVSGKLWTRAIQLALDENKTVFIPDLGEPYYFDAPLVIRSGQHLIVAPTAELRLKPGTNTCLIRNEHQVRGQDGPVNLEDNPDVDITIEGGIWTTLAINWEESNGNVQGGPDPANAIHGHGTILLSHVKRVRVSNVTIKECRPHGIQLSNISQFLVENIRFVNHQRDGVHVNGPASHGVIRDIGGMSGDDMVALNAWDWKNTCMAFGPIHHILVEKVHAGAPGSDYRADIRLLGGTKHYPDGKTIACDIEHCVVRDVTGVRTIKMYDQPNLEMGRDNDFADPIGNFKDLSFSGIVVENPAEPLFSIGSNVDGVSIDNVTVKYAKPADSCKIVQIGPMSATYKPDPNRPETWTEIFSPDKDCTVRNLRLTNVRKQWTADGKTVVLPVDSQECIDVVTQKLNPDYPKTTPRGGKGRGILITDTGK